MNLPHSIAQHWKRLNAIKSAVKGAVKTAVTMDDNQAGIASLFAIINATHQVFKMVTKRAAIRSLREKVSSSLTKKHVNTSCRVTM